MWAHDRSRHDDGAHAVVGRRRHRRQCRARSCGPVTGSSSPTYMPSSRTSSGSTSKPTNTVSASSWPANAGHVVRSDGQVAVVVDQRTVGGRRRRAGTGCPGSADHVAAHEQHRRRARRRRRGRRAPSSAGSQSCMSWARSGAAGHTRPEVREGRGAAGRPGTRSTAPLGPLVVGADENAAIQSSLTSTQAHAVEPEHIDARQHQLGSERVQLGEQRIDEPSADRDASGKVGGEVELDTGQPAIEAGDDRGHRVERRAHRLGEPRDLVGGRRQDRRMRARRPPPRSHPRAASRIGHLERRVST